MRNLKKVLSLSLALVMLLGMMVVGAGAATTYTDANDINYTEAVDVMSAVGVFSGTDKGDFQPNGDLTREQAAKIITYMLMGQSAADKLSTTKAPYKDVAADRWSAGSIAYCTTMNIIAGDGNGAFYPTQTVNGYAFAKMLLVALGYDPTIQTYTGSNWAINVAKDALTAGLTKGLDVALTNTLTREQAAQMAFNALKADMVYYTNKGTEITTDGMSVVVGASAPTKVANDISADYRDDGTDAYMQFCEQYFGKLKLDNDANTGDAFGRPSIEWTFEGKAVGTYANTPAFTYTADCKGGPAKTALEKDLKGYDFTTLTQDAYLTDGKAEGASGASAIDSAADLAAVTGNGVLVEVYANDNKEITAVTVINTALMQITKIDAKKNEVALNAVNTAVAGTIAKVDEDNANYAALSGMKEEDYVLVTAAYDGASYVVQTVAEPETVTGTVTKVVSNKSLTLGGTVYEFAAKQQDVASQTVDVKNDKILYLDSYGYAIYAKGATAVTSANTVYVVAEYQGVTDWGTTDMFQGVLPDGTVITGEYDSAKPTPGTAYQYTMNGGKYTLTAAAGNSTTLGAAQLTAVSINASDKKLNDGNLNNFYAENVNFVYVNGEKGTLKTTVKTGVQTMSLTTNDYAVITKDSNGNFVVSTVFIKGAAITSSSDIIYVAATMNASNSTGTAVGKDGKTILTGYEVYVNGEKETVYFNGTQTSNAGFYTYSIDDVTGAYTLGAAPTNVITGQQVKKDGVVRVNGEYYVEFNASTAADNFTATDATVVDTTPGGDVDSMAALKDAVSGGAKNVAVVYDSDAKTITTIYVLA